MLYVDPLANTHSARFAPEAVEGQRRETAFRELEHYFAQTLLREMRRTVPEDSLFGGSEMKTYEEFLDDALSAQMAERGELGIASMLEQQLRVDEMRHQLQGEAAAGRASGLGAVLSEIGESRVQASLPISGAGLAQTPHGAGRSTGGWR